MQRRFDRRSLSSAQNVGLLVPNRLASRFGHVFFRRYRAAEGGPLRLLLFAQFNDGSLDLPDVQDAVDFFFAYFMKRPVRDDLVDEFVQLTASHRSQLSFLAREEAIRSNHLTRRFALTVNRWLNRSWRQRNRASSEECIGGALSLALGLAVRLA